MHKLIMVSIKIFIKKLIPSNFVKFSKHFKSVLERKIFDMILLRLNCWYLNITLVFCHVFDVDYCLDRKDHPFCQNTCRELPKLHDSNELFVGMHQKFLCFAEQFFKFIATSVNQGHIDTMTSRLNRIRNELVEGKFIQSFVGCSRLPYCTLPKAFSMYEIVSLVYAFNSILERICFSVGMIPFIAQFKPLLINQFILRMKRVMNML